MKTRTIRLNPGEEKFITADEVRDEQLRSRLQVRAVSIVRPSTEAEEDVLMQEIEALSVEEEDVEGEEGEETAEQSSDNMPS